MDKGVFETPKEFPPSYFTPFIWTLVDSDEARGVPEYLISHGTSYSVIFVSPPVCIDLPQNPSEMISYLDLLARDSAGLILDWLREDRQSQYLAMDAASDNIILIERKEEFELPTVAPITDYVESRFRKKLVLEEDRIFEYVPQGGVTAGLIYGSLSQRVVGANINTNQW